MRRKPLIAHWSHSSLMAYLRNPLAWYMRYVEKVYDVPRTPASIIGNAGHTALQHFYEGTEKEVAIRLGLEYLENIPDFEINFGKARTVRERKAKRTSMTREYLQAIGFYFEKPPRHQVLGVEVKGMANVKGLPLPVKAVSDLVISSRGNPGAVDIVDHKFVDSFVGKGEGKTAYVLQAIFNYYTILELFNRPVKRFLVYECKKKKNADGSPQLRKHTFRYEDLEDEFTLFHRLIKDATEEISRTKVFLPNPGDMFEGAHSYEIYRLGLIDP
jgi:hypothetical protein